MKKDFNIPRGNDVDYDNIRKSLVDRLKKINEGQNLQEPSRNQQEPINNKNNEAFRPAHAKADIQPKKHNGFSPFMSNEKQNKSQNPNVDNYAPKQNIINDHPIQGSPIKKMEQENASPQNTQKNQIVNKLNDDVFSDKSKDDDLFAKPISQGPAQEPTFAQPINSPSMAGRTSAEDNLATAAHSTEPVKYKPKSKNSVAKTVIILVCMLIIVSGLSWALREFVFQAYEIPSGSMESTIMTGDMVFAEKVSPRLSSPRVGEIITFADLTEPGRILIKRVVATGGQTVDIKNNAVYVDGKELNEPYTNGLPSRKLGSSKVNYPYTVPENSVWVMGDNRTNSQDSRYFGAVSNDSVIGKALFVYWPVSNMKTLE